MKVNAYNNTFVSNKEDLFGMVDNVYSGCARSRIGNTLKTRIHQLETEYPEYSHLNMAGKISCEKYKTIIKNNPMQLSAEDLYIESLALSIFSNYADFWCEYEIYQIKNQYKNYYYYFDDFQLTYNENDYHSQLIDNIQQINRVYLTMYETFPVRLADAVLLSNLHAFVKGKKWYEMLYALELSTRGTHFIMSVPVKKKGWR
ncbi:acyl-homoserine-lactone synthase [Vibrio mangrovi]|uniref:acyl-homoserine-lactone synthase n=1 Tax=Vibrio mangrovi TaxID=474394 RepID=A0A1Y6IVS6_9VIBR|nr:acyl-homoserine-lactone synthase [Vibrio mangrovi]MDW6004839.1 acyl-homoserine-lactone synthase [Vibrio mangrovi]SMS01131.1 Acyl-homoserine-lactone synthase LuxM [Vibrio mangrovi]